MSACDKVLRVVQGSIACGLTDSREVVDVGDRPGHPAGIEHAADVGPEGVHCLGGHRWLAWRPLARG